MNKNIGLYSILLLVLFAVPLVCAQEVRQYGNASWYASSFHGRKTASGECYDKDEFTGAHRELPFGTIKYLLHTAASSDYADYQFVIVQKER